MSAVLLNRLTIVAVATHNAGELPPLADSRTVQLIMNSSMSIDRRNLNTERIDNAYVELHWSLRHQMYTQAGGPAHGTPQRLTLGNYTLSFTCEHDTTPIFYNTDEGSAEGSNASALL